MQAWLSDVYPVKEGMRLWVVEMADYPYLLEVATEMATA